ncbi:MAG: helix-turn-helix domain-containing protein [Chloroflexi bacterium]|nr:helix-turn-helix domain-containing protein [Chloroflexota bacterium]
MNDTDDKTRQISMTEAADLYGFSRRYFSALAKKGRLRAIRIGRSWVTTPADVEEYIRTREQKGAYRADIGNHE